ncbi:MAG: formyltransferase family protein [Acidobacteriota bacterium]
MIILSHGGIGRLLEILSANELVEIAGVFVESVREPQRTFADKIKRSIRYDGYIETLKKLLLKIVGQKTASFIDSRAVRDEQDDLERVVRELQIPFYKVDNFHTFRSIELLKRSDADLGILYGTNIIKESVFDMPRLGSINLHQGLAPYYRGGPTVFWELYNGEKEIGLTVHFVAAEVDTGDIVRQRSVPLRYDFSLYRLDYEKYLSDFRETLKEPSAEILLDAVNQIASGRFERIKQDKTIGKRYRIPTKRQKDELLKILKSRKKQRDTKST